MQLVITAPASTDTATAPTVEISWVSKGGSSINSADGRYQLRKNSKGEWKINEDGKTVATGLLTKEAAKAYAVTLATHPASTGDIKAALIAGEARVYSLRANGTTRRRHFLTDQEFLAAKQIEAARELGKSMAFIAGELHVSISQVRRILIDLAITEQLRSASEAELAAMLVGAADVSE